MPGFRLEGGDVVREGIWTGDVVVYGGCRYKVTKINPANYRVLDEAGKTWNLRRTANVTKAEDQSWDGPSEKTEYQKYLEQVESGLTLGSVVEIIHPTHARRYPGKHVIIQTKSDGTFRLAKLGGDNGRYLRGFTVADLKEVGA